MNWEKNLNSEIREKFGRKMLKARFAEQTCCPGSPYPGPHLLRNGEAAGGERRQCCWAMANAGSVSSTSALLCGSLWRLPWAHTHLTGTGSRKQGVKPHFISSPKPVVSDVLGPRGLLKKFHFILKYLVVLNTGNAGDRRKNK